MVECDCGKCYPSPTKELIISHLYGKSEDQCKVKLEKNTKGYNWEISISGPDFESCNKKLREQAEFMQGWYGAAQQ